MLKAIYKTGSSLFLPNSNDNDIVYFYETKEEAKEALRHHKHDKSVDVHFDYVRPLKVTLYCYMYHFMELIEGEDLHLADYSIFDHKEEYKELLSKYIEWLPLEEKWWYHILTACYLFTNNKYKLTASQKKDIQKVHDEGITNKLKEFCINTLNDLQ